MPTPTAETLPSSGPVTTSSPLVAVAFLAFAAINLFVLGWVSPAAVTRAESTAGFRTWAGEVFGNAPTAGRVFVGRVR